MRTQTVAASLVLMLIAGAFPFVMNIASGDNEPNNDFDSAEVIFAGGHNGTLTDNGDQQGQKDDVDYYRFNVQDGQFFDVKYMVNSGSFATMTSFLKDKSAGHSSGPLHPGVLWEIKHTLGQGDGGTYFLEVMLTVTPDDVSYHFDLIIDDQQDGGQDGDAGDTIDTARAVTTSTFDGWIDDLDTHDYYSFSVPASSRINATLTTGHTLDRPVAMNLYGNTKNNLLYTDLVNPDVSRSLIFQTSDVTGGTYFLRIHGNNEYTIAIDLTPENDADSKGDVPSTIGDSFHLPGNGTYSGILRDDDQADFYKFDVLPGQIINFTLSASTDEKAAISCALYNPEKKQIHYMDWLATGVEGQDYYVTNTTGGGVYYIKVGGGNSYRLTLLLTMQIDANRWGDAGDDIRVPTPVDVNTDYNGLMRDMDNRDYYSFAAEADRNVTVNFSLIGGQPSLSMTIYDTAKDIVKYSDLTAFCETGSWNFTPKSTGTYILFFSPGPSDNCTYRFIISPERDSTPPVVSILAPRRGATLSTSTVMVTGTASDDRGLGGVQLKVNGIDTPVTGTTSWSARARLREGSNMIVATATDTSGNSASQTVNVIYRQPSRPFIPGFEALFLVAAMVLGLVLLRRRRV